MKTIKELRKDYGEFRLDIILVHIGVLEEFKDLIDKEIEPLEGALDHGIGISKFKEKYKRSKITPTNSFIKGQISSLQKLKQKIEG